MIASWLQLCNLRARQRRRQQRSRNVPSSRRAIARDDPFFLGSGISQILPDPVDQRIARCSGLGEIFSIGTTFPLRLLMPPFVYLPTSHSKATIRDPNASFVLYLPYA